MGLKNCLLGFAAALVLGAGAAAIADDATTAPSVPEPRSLSRSHIAAPFNLLPDLTDDQKTKIRDIHTEILDEERELRQKEHDQIAALLTDDQKKELDDLVARETMEKKAAQEERRAKAEEEKAQSDMEKLDGGATTQPAGQPAGQ
jgi:Spy/CpxP family protein refolding chaperone